MQRAGVFIGVNRSGGLESLRDAVAGAEQMAAWARCDTEDPFIATEVITDATGPVDPEQILEAIERIVDGPPVDQLVLYFAGHGVNIARNEHWLLSDAPRRANAAVNVSGSVDLARYCGIPHVILFSDACRVAAAGVQAQGVRGVEVFPNEASRGSSRPVDQFYACELGLPAVEVATPGPTSAGFRALYTAELLESLAGSRPAVLAPGSPADGFRYVRPRLLDEHLKTEVPRRIISLGLAHAVSQKPDAIITAPDASWLARHHWPGVIPRGPAPSPSVDAVTGAHWSTVAIAAVLGAVQLGGEWLRGQRRLRPDGDDQSSRAAQDIASRFDTDFAAACGVKVRGARVAQVYTQRGISTSILRDGQRVEVAMEVSAPCSLVLVFQHGCGTVIPALPGFIASLTFANGKLADLAYEPSVGNQRWAPESAATRELRALRAVAAIASQIGRFRLDQPNAGRIARRMQSLKGVDPTLAIYAGYAYHDLQDLERLRGMSNFLREVIGTEFFDLAMLGRRLLDRRIDATADVTPFVPLLSQGWALLKAHRIRLHPALAALEGTMVESLWSLFDTKGVGMLAEAQASGEVK